MNCILQQEPAHAFVEKLQASDWAPSSFPVSASMELTAACNLRCLHCYLNYPGAVPKDKSTAETVRIMDILRDLGVLFLVFTGGDPLCRPDFKQIWLQAKRHGFFLTLFSNGTLLTDDLMDFLADAPPRRLELTVYGHTERTYEAVTGVPGSFHRFRYAVDGLLRRGLLVRLKTMVMRTNAHELPAIRQWAIEQGCDFRYDAIIHPCLDHDATPLGERLDPREVALLRHKDRERPMVNPGSEPAVFPPRRHLFECGAGIMTVHVDAAHQAHPCMTWRMDPFDLAKHPSVNAWQTHIAALRARPAPGGPCDTCEDRSRCQCCAALSVLEAGNADGAPPFFCRLAQEERRLDS